MSAASNALLIDLDGVIYQGEQAVPGAVDAISWLQQAEVPHLYVTNTTSRPRKAIVTKLAAMGALIAEERIFTPPVAASTWLRQLGIRRVALFVPKATREEFADFDMLPDDAESGAQAVIVLAETVPEGFADRIRGLGARVLRSKGNYEQSIVTAKAEAEANGWTHLADGSWEGYLDAPALVMEGYTVLAEECRAEFARNNEWPTLVVLQAGVGGLAGAVAAHIRAFWEQQPEIIVVEPDAAACLLRSVEAGKLTHVDGPESNMGRLDCKDASLIAFEALLQDADIFVTVSDEEATAAATELSGAGITTTPSGGASVAAISKLSPGFEARVMMIASEGPERT